MKIYHWTFHTQEHGKMGVNTLFNSKKTAKKKFQEWINEEYGSLSPIHVIKLEKTIRQL